ncbi:MAG: DNA-directed RNA polymerase subunit D [Thermoplasmata archaeon]|nr:DNA-directed RNA polymerase subunit D [Thermoplasmata archaeon]
MKIEKINISENRAEVIISNAEVHFLNAFRRTLLIDVPKMAIDKVEIHLGAISDETGRTYESTTPLFDEIIAHRLGMVPVPTDGEALLNDHLKPEAECDCANAGCQNCQVMFSLNKRGPATVYSGDLEPLGDEKLKPKDPKIPIVKLTEDEGILIYAIAHLGTGKMHARWQAVHAAGYRPIPEITINQKKVNDPESVVDNCPSGVYEISKKSLNAKNPETCILCRTCEHEDISGKDAIKVNANTSRYFFKFETDGAVDPKTAIIYALRVLEARYSDFQESLEEMK